MRKRILKLARRQLLDMLEHLAPGDVVTVTRIDWLPRSTFDLFAILYRTAAGHVAGLGPLV